MQPIHELLSRIRWDADFGSGDFELEIYDRVLDSLIRMPLGEVSEDPDNTGMLSFYDAEGEQHSVPLHRIRRVHKNNTCIWERPEA